MSDNINIGVITDVHSNLPALEAVLDDMPPAVDEIVCLGDIIGYNAQPKACLEIIHERCSHSVQGNHDRDVVDPERYHGSLYTLSGGNRAVMIGLEVAQRQLSDADIDWLTALPPTKFIHDERILLCHSHPEETDTYVHKGKFPSVATYMEPTTDVLLLGHTHEQAAVDMSKFDRHGWVVNPGSVGQPRDGHKAKYAVVTLGAEDTTVELRSVSYPVSEIIARNVEYDLPKSTSDRLRE